MTYDELIKQHLSTLKDDEKMEWIIYMYNIFKSLERPDFIDKAIMSIFEKLVLND